MVPSLSISSTLSFPECHPVDDYAFFLVFLSFLSFLHYRVLEGSFCSRCNQSSCHFFILFYVGYFFFRWLYAVPIFSHSRSNWSAPSISSISEPSLPISSTLSFPECHPVDDYVFFLVFLSFLSSLHYRVLESSSYSRCNKSSCHFFILFYVRYFFLRWLYAVPIFSHSRSNWSAPSISSTLEQKYWEAFSKSKWKETLLLRFVTVVKRLRQSILSSATLTL